MARPAVSRHTGCMSQTHISSPGRWPAARRNICSTSSRPTSLPVVVTMLNSGLNCGISACSAACAPAGWVKTVWISSCTWWMLRSAMPMSMSRSMGLLSCMVVLEGVQRSQLQQGYKPCQRCDQKRDVIGPACVQAGGEHVENHQEKRGAHAEGHLPGEVPDQDRK